MIHKDLKSISKIILFSLAIILSLIVVELFSRILLKGHVNSSELLEKSDNVIISYQLKPNTTKIIRNTDGADIEYSINYQGFRGKPFQPNFGEALLFLGDSVAFGFGVEEKDMYSAYIENILKNKYKIQTQSINLGVNGYSIAQYVEVYKEKSALFSPSIIIVGFALNDANPYWDLAWDDSKEKPKFKTINREVQETYKGPFGGRFPWVKFLDKIHTYNVLIKPMIQRIQDSQIGIGSRNDTNTYEKRAYFDNSISDGWESRKLQILELKKLVERNRQKFLLIISPNAAQIRSEDTGVPQEKIVNFALANKIEYIDFLPIFMNSSTPIEELFIDDVHPSKDGHMLIAKTVSQYIADHTNIGE